jgi:hypothetical protein
VHLQTHLIAAFNCISKLARLRPPSSHNHGLQAHLQMLSNTASKYINMEQHQVYRNSRVMKVDRVTGMVLDAGPGNLSGVWVQTAKTVSFDSRTVHNPDPLHIGRTNLDTYPSTCGFYRTCLHPSVPICGSVFRDFLFMVPFSNSSAKCKMLTLVRQCPAQMYRSP